MTSEIRANTLKNRVGLGTISFTNTGPVVSGIVTANSFSGIVKASNLTSGRVVFTNTGGQLEASGNLTYNGTTLVSGSPFDLNGDLDVDGHTNLDNVSIAGVSTFSGNVLINSNLNGSNANFTGELTVAEMVGHTGDTHTKLSFPANDTIAFTTGGTERARITSGGNLQIDNDSGQIQLGDDQDLSIYHNGSNGFLKNTTGQQIYRSGTHTFENAAGSTEYLRIDSSGRLIVGGGTHAGGSALVVKGGGVNTYSTVGLFGATATPSNNAIFAQIRFGSGTTQVGATINAKADADWGSLNDYPTRLEFYTAPDGSGTVAERLRITSGGNVNIGTGELTQTSRKLNVYGGATRATQTSGGNTVEVFGHTTSGQSYGLLVNAGTNGNDYAATFRNSGGTTLFRIRGDGVVYVAGEPSSGAGKFNVKPGTPDSYLKIRNASDFDGTLTGNVIDNRDGANSTSRDLLIRSNKLVLWQGTNEQIRILDEGHVQFSGTTEEITLKTSDGSDNGYMNLSGGGACSQNRGAQLVLSGNERSSNGGLLQLLAGNSGSATGKIQMYTGGNERLVVQDGGVLSQRVNSNARFSHGILEITSSASPSQLKIKTNIPYSGFSHAESVTIRGFRYGGRDTVDIQICWHVYAGQFYNRIASSSGGWAPTITLAVESGKVVIHFNSLGYWHKIYVADYYSAYGDYDYARGWTYDFTAINGDSGLPVNTVPYKNDWGGLTYNDNHNAAGGDLNIHDGNLIVASGHGIDFSATANAGGGTMSNELFDDYEEGSWTPSYSRPNMTITHGYREGYYTKVGRAVHVVGRLHTTQEQGSSTGGPILVTGLPFTVRAVRCALSVRPSTWSNDHPSFASFELNQTHFELLEEVEGNPSGSQDLGGGRFAGGTGNFLWFSGTYFTDT